MHKLKEKLMEALYEYEEMASKTQGKISDFEIQKIHTLTDTVKNLEKIKMLENENGQSEDDGSSYARGRGRYARRDSMGRYSREGYAEEGGSYRGGNSYGEYSREGYSRDGYSRGGNEELLEKMEKLMKTAKTEEERQAIKGCIHKLENS